MIVLYQIRIKFEISRGSGELGMLALTRNDGGIKNETKRGTVFVVFSAMMTRE